MVDKERAPRFEFDGPSCTDTDPHSGRTCELAAGHPMPHVVRVSGGSNAWQPAEPWAEPEQWISGLSGPAYSTGASARLDEEAVRRVRAEERFRVGQELKEIIIEQQIEVAESNGSPMEMMMIQTILGWMHTKVHEVTQKDGDK